MPTIDNLDIRISTTLTATDKALDSLISKLGVVTSSLTSINGTSSRTAGTMNTTATAIRRTSTSMTSATRKTRSLASVIGKLYANYFLLIRAINGFKKAITSTADYIEAFNYFEVSFNKIADDWSKDYEKYGYENAESYASSFAKRARESLLKLSGLKIEMDAEGNGLLTETGMKNLGLNIQEITQYASQLASVTNSVGLTGEASLAASSAFTKLAGDISSLFNLDYSSVAKNLQSGLIGQSRALYKYGIDITNATLQTYAYEMGIEKAVSEMTQAEKMQLRMIAILKQSKVSWGDLANTINSPSNMMRQFKNNLKEAGMTLGQLFMPLLQKVLPVLNGVTIAFKRLFTSMAGIFGIKLDMSSFGQGGTDLEETYDGLSDSLDDVSESAKKAKAGLRGFDELKTISQKDSSSSGVGNMLDITEDILNATSEYERVWESAYEKMEQRAEKFANSVSRKLEPIKKIFEDIAVGDWFAVGKDVSALVVGIFNFFTRAIENVDWFALGNNIGKYFAGLDWSEIFLALGRSLGAATEAFFAFFEGMWEGSPIMAIIVGLKVIPALFSKIIATKFIIGFTKLATSVKFFGASVMGSSAATATLAKTAPKLAAVAATLRTAFANFRYGIEFGNLSTGLSEGFRVISNKLSFMTKGLIGVGSGLLAFYGVSDSIQDIVRGTGSLTTNLVELTGAVAIAGVGLSAVFGFPAGIIAAGFVGITGALFGLKKSMDEVDAKKLGETIKDALTNPGGTPITVVAESVANSISSIGDRFALINEKSQELDTAQKNIKDVWLEIETIKTKMDAGVLSVEEGTKQLSSLFGELVTIAQTMFSQMEAMFTAGFGENGYIRQYADAIGEDLSDEYLGLMGITDDMKQKVIELADKMSNPNISAEEYASYQSELFKLLGMTDDITKSLSDMETEIGKIDMSAIVKNGKPNIEVIKDALGQVKESATTAIEELDETKIAYQEIFDDMLANTTDPAKIAIIESSMNFMEGAIENAKQTVSQKAIEFTNEIQNSLFNPIDDIVEDRKKQWSKKGFWETLGSTMFGGAEGEGVYVKEGLSNYKKNYVDPIDKEIKSMLDKLGVENGNYASQTMKDITKKMFDKDNILWYETDILKSNWKDIFTKSLSGLDETFKTEGKNSVSGYNKGISENASSTQKEITNWQNQNQEAVKKANDSHSPAKKYTALAKDTVEGYNIGIEENADSTESVISEWLKGLMKLFSDFAKDVSDSWKDIEYSMTSPVQNAKNEIQKTIEDIKQMFKFTWSLPRIKTPHFRIDGNFDFNTNSVPTVSVDWYKTGGYIPNSFSLIGAGENGVPELLGSVGGRPAIAGGEEITGIRDEIRQSSSAEVELLRQQNRLLQAILEKEYGISDDQIGRSAQRYAKDYFNRTGNEAYSF